MTVTFVDRLQLLYESIVLILLSFSSFLFLDLSFFASLVNILIAAQGLAPALGSLICSFKCSVL
jgi:hypothetical protein